jgi:ribosomal protein L11 methyltransferase
MTQENPKDYWDKNIDNWGKFYLESSHSQEEFNSPSWLTKLYGGLVVPIEARLMAQRYRLTIDFIDRYVKPGMVVADVGCGTGIFTVEMLKRGARVIAIDISASSLESTKKNVFINAPESLDLVRFLQLNVSEKSIPTVDIAIAMGVTPYVTEIEPFYQNILSQTRIFYCLVLDPKHWANKIRHIFPILNVRNVHCFNRNRIDDILRRNNCSLIERLDFASGYLDITDSIR